MKIGYARVSTDEQHLDLQLAALNAYCCDVIFSDQGESGARFDRPGLTNALNATSPGSTLVVWRLDRLGRSLQHLVNIICALGERNVRVVSLTESIDTRSSSGRFTFHLLAAMAEFERSLISERTRAGMTAARARGQRPGRPRALTSSQIAEAQLLLKTNSEQIVARILKVHVRTLRRQLQAQSELDNSKISST
ncbi:recombinase family protein [Burkholderia territorii]|uniref:recombinase family protein n=1 Tax=Burkholderia territorii TaxID=1503055 RepID=UPI0009C0A2C9|nr:recombinase family protein [Burkholderia territorii]